MLVAPGIRQLCYSRHPHDPAPPTSRIVVLGLVLVSVAAASAETTVLRAERMLDVRSGRILSPAVLVVDDGLIRAVNPASLPRDAAVIDLGNVTLLPGFIDMHVHVLLRDATSYRADIAGRNECRRGPALDRQRAQDAPRGLHDRP